MFRYANCDENIVRTDQEEIMPSGFSSGARSLGTSERPRFEEAEIPRRERPAPEYTSKKLSAERKITELLALADIQINGPRPWDIQINDRRFYERVLAEGSLGAGESYMDGWWEVEALDEFFDRVRRSGVENEVRRWSVAWLALRSKLFNLQSRSRAAEVAHDTLRSGQRSLRGDARSRACSTPARIGRTPQRSMKRRKTSCT